MRCSKILILTAMILMGLALAGTASAGEAPSTSSDSHIRIYFDRTQEAQLLWPYKLRILVLYDGEGSGSCFQTLPNGTVTIVCERVKGAMVSATYLDSGEFRSGRTNEDGIAEFDFRIWSFPTASFKISVKGVEERITVGVSPWALIALTCFSATLSSLIYCVRRGSW